MIFFPFMTFGTGAGGMFGTPAMQNLMEQISSNSSLMQNMMSSPYVQNMMRSMASNPELSAQVQTPNLYTFN